MTCHLEHNRFSISRIFLIFFSLFTYFFALSSLLPTWFLLLTPGFHSPVSTYYLLSVCQLQCQCPAFRLPERGSGQWVGHCRIELLPGLSPPGHTNKHLPLPLLPSRSLCPGCRSLWYKLTCAKTHVDPIFQKGALSIDSSQRDNRCTSGMNS